MDWLFRPELRRLCAGLWALAWVVVALLLLLPMPVAAPERSDLLAHFLIFAVLAFAAVSFSRSTGQLAVMALVTVAGGTLLEAAQKLAPSRSFDLTDAAANALGAGAGLVLALVVLGWLIGPADPARRGGRKASAPRSS
jgi:VanZ family protein